MFLQMFRKKHKLDKLPQSNRDKPLYKWGNIWHEYEGGKWKIAKFETVKRHSQRVVA